MQYLELASEAQLHRETYIAILKGVLRRTGDKRRFAEQVGITAQYLSYLLDPYHRVPSPALAARIANHTPLDGAQRESLLEHMLLANEQRLKLARTARESTHPAVLANQLDALQSTKEEAIFTTDFTRAEVHYRTVRDAGWRLLEHAEFRDTPLKYAELCLWLSDVENVLNLAGNALYLAKRARYVLVQQVRNELDSEERPQYDMLEFEALRAEAVAYHNLGLSHQAYDCCDAAEQMRLIEYEPEMWLPHLYRDKINALGGKPRFSIREAEWLVAQGKSHCERCTHPHTALWALMLDRSLGEAYIRYGNLRKANQSLAAQLDSFAHLPAIGSLHRVLVLSTYAEVRWLDGDEDGWNAVVRSALDIAFEAGLAHQIEQIRGRFGSAVEPIMAEVSSV